MEQFWNLQAVHEIHVNKFERNKINQLKINHEKLVLTVHSSQKANFMFKSKHQKIILSRFCENGFDPNQLSWSKCTTSYKYLHSPILTWTRVKVWMH